MAPAGKAFPSFQSTASGYWHNAGGESSAACHVNEDGTVSLTEGHPDIGGSRASMAMMVAEVLGIPFERVRPVVGDTTAIGFSASTGGSRVTFAGGMAATQAAQKVIEELKKRAAICEMPGCSTIACPLVWTCRCWRR